MRSIASRGLVPVETTASFPNPAQDYYEGGLSLDRQLIPHPISTYLLRVTSDAMVSVGIHTGDTLLVDRALDPRPGRILVVVHDAEHRLGRFDIDDGQAVLTTDDEILPLTADVVPWGVAYLVLHRLPGAPP